MCPSSAPAIGDAEKKGKTSRPNTEQEKSKKSSRQGTADGKNGLVLSFDAYHYH